MRYFFLSFRFECAKLLLAFGNGGRDLSMHSCRSQPFFSNLLEGPAVGLGGVGTGIVFRSQALEGR